MNFVLSLPMNSTRYIRKIGLGFLLMLVVSLLTISCKKKLFDYRKAYVGKYTFQLNRTVDTTGQGSFDTTYYYQGEIKMANKNDLIMDWYTGGKLQVTVSKKGEITLNSNEVGQFTDKTCIIQYSYSSGSPQVTSSFIMVGTKIK